MKPKLESVIKVYDDYTIGYIRYGSINIWASYGPLTDAMYRLTAKLKEFNERYRFYK
jgi:hypothetical protein